ncbi:MAG TPA: hypothetical protein VG709_02570, partial [Actinomycetota bacterium]|nr:hypothetical protein [Actinomycetota bacterium]
MPAGTFGGRRRVGGHLAARFSTVDSGAWLRRVVAVAVALFVLLALAPTPGMAGGSGARDVCTTGDAQAAAVDLFGAGSKLVEIERISGLDTALVLEPRIYPGTRRRMIAADGQWCEATSGFNPAWR